MTDSQFCEITEVIWQIKGLQYICLDIKNDLLDVFFEFRNCSAPWVEQHKFTSAISDLNSMEMVTDICKNWET
jgi:hypothetical protein